MAYDKEKAKMKPTRAVIQALPNLVDGMNKPERAKLRMLEKDYERPFMNHNYCDREMFAYYLCARNMTTKYSKKACLEEIMDLRQCIKEPVRTRNRELMRKEGVKAGDRITELHSSKFWIY